MKRSLSDAWQEMMATREGERGQTVSLSPYIAARRVHNRVQIMLEVRKESARTYKCVSCANFLTFAATFESFQKTILELDTEYGLMSARERYVKKRAAQSDNRQAKQIKNFLEAKRAEYAEKHRAKLEAEEERLNGSIRKVRPMIEYVLNRYKSVVDQFAYANVYGRPVEKIFY